MTRAPIPLQTRRAIVASLGGAAFSTSVRAAPGPRIVILLGDSITAGYGLAQKDALPAQLELALRRLGVDVQVHGAGVSGDTTADGLARVDFSVRADAALCLVELGGNDLLQGADPVQIGASFAHDFNAAFPAAAEAGHAPLYPFLLEGVAGNPALLQADHIHPNPAGVKIIAAKLAPFVAKNLK